MGLDDLLPGNTKRARATDVNAFLRFIQSEDVNLETIILYLAILATRAGRLGRGKIKVMTVFNRSDRTEFRASNSEKSKNVQLRFISIMKTFFYDTLEDYCCVFLRDMYKSGTVYQLCTSCVLICLTHLMGRRSDLSWYGYEETCCEGLK
uniref:AlNc14C87G5552 protein n=1 Tax=Albugo laibachii Nc14 TaxID=890382 RepID=F0WG20_9STRA|nr:AlNc14C87G5552 [Albugo laibachii Nc14]|eukprot:CCA20154.1 AlNc14C87G5552 [Albugo laibachii Nc14]